MYSLPTNWLVPNLPELLNDSRAHDYGSWSRVEWCLRNLFKEFPQRSYKYDESDVKHFRIKMWCMTWIQGA